MTLRPTILLTLLMACGGSTLASAAPDAIQAGPDIAIATTPSGKIQGFVHNAILTYRGIPYATAERFMPPQPTRKWADTKMALLYGNICPQSASNPLANFLFSGPHLQQSDDCQNLNIWTPALSDHKPRPVMVWLHGGGFQAGSAIESYAYDGENLSRSGDVVVVSVNHRLNVMGHLDLSAYGQQYQHSANLGVMDLVAALQWIKTNIAQFGGDPNNVTIFGESGGGAKVLTLMATPSAKGLFHKAIVQSGAVEGMGMTLLAPKTTQRVAELTLNNLKLNRRNISKLKTLPYDEIAQASQKALDQTAKEQQIPSVMGNGIALFWAPSVDGDYIPSEPVGENYPAMAKDIPLLIGSNLTEWNTIYAYFGDIAKAQTNNHHHWSVTQTQEQLQSRYGKNATAIQQAFARAYPERQPADALFVDSFLRLPAIKTAQLKADQHAAAVYQYLFSWDTPLLGGFAMSYHTAEIPFVFNSLALTETAHGNGDEAKALADTMSGAWVNFAKTGNPNGHNMPQWQAYNRDNGAVMVFDNQPHMKYHHDDELMKLLTTKQ